MNDDVLILDTQETDSVCLNDPLQLKRVSEKLQRKKLKQLTNVKKKKQKFKQKTKQKLEIQTKKNKKINKTNQKIQNQAIKRKALV